MVKKRIFSVILAFLLVICCVAEAFFIKGLQNDNKKQKEEIAGLQEQTELQATQIQTLSDTISAKADDPMIQFYLPEDIYVCASQGADIYNNAVVYGVNLSSYAFYWESSIGNSRHDRFEIPPMTTVGDYDVTLHIYDLSLHELAEKTTILHIVPDSLYGVEGENNDTMADFLLQPVVYSKKPAEVPEILKAVSIPWEEAEIENPNVILVFPSVYEVYADLDATMENVKTLIADIQNQYGDTPILIVEPAYPGSNAQEEAQVDEDGQPIQRWAYAEKTMIFRLVSDLEKTYIEEDNIFIVPNALMTNSENSPEKVGNSIYGLLCHLVSEKIITTK